jgi:arsenate reductase
VQAFRYLRNRISAFVALPVGSLDRMTLRNRLDGIGRLEGASGLATEVSR